MSRRYSASLTGAAAIAVVAMGLAACSSGGGSSNGKSSSSGSGSSAKGKTVQLIVGNASDPFYVTMECGAQQEAAKLGVKLTSNGPSSFSVPAQKPLIDNVQVSKPDALLVAPTDVSKLDPDL